LSSKLVIIVKVVHMCA